MSSLEFEIGERVQVRDGENGVWSFWREGTVTQNNPVILVQCEGYAPAQFKFVRKMASLPPNYVPPQRAKIPVLVKTVPQVQNFCNGYVYDSSGSLVAPFHYVQAPIYYPYLIPYNFNPHQTFQQTFQTAEPPVVSDPDVQNSKEVKKDVGKIPTILGETHFQLPKHVKCIFNGAA